MKNIVHYMLLCIISSVANDLYVRIIFFAIQEETSGHLGTDRQSGADGQSGISTQPAQTEDVAAEAVEETEFTQPWDVPTETQATPVDPVDIPAVTGLQGSVAASPSVSQISQFLDTLNAPAEGGCS